MLVPVLLISVAACDNTLSQPASPLPPPPSTTSSTAPSSAATSSAAPAKPTIASLAEQPCQALTREDTVAFQVFVDGSEQSDPSGGKACQWGMAGALITFTAFPATDMTKDPRFQHLTADTIEGHHTLLGQGSRSDKTSYFIVVTTGPGQSFRILATGFAPEKSGSPAMEVGRKVAAAVVRNLA
jgi:hypothetical protein